MPLRDDATRILEAAVAAADPRAAVTRALRLDGDLLHLPDGESVDLAAVARVLLVAAGKAALGMTQGAREVLGERIAGGSVTLPAGSRAEISGMEVWEAAHPIPDTHGLAAASAALEVARGAGADDLVLCLLSGGASALWPAPPRGVSLTDLQQTTGALLRAGAPIQEINTVRKHLSRIAGGGLARAAAPARLVTLAVSDVVGAPVDVIGSGPTLPDPTTFADALGVVLGRQVQLPPGAGAYLQAGAAGEAPETPKPGDPVFRRNRACVIASVRDALEGAAREAEQRGYRAEIVTEELVGEARHAARRIATLARGARARGGDRPVALLLGGETTVTVTGDGRGGRNQELALALGIELEGEAGVLVAAMGTDGVDGPTDAAGAFADGRTVARGRERGLDARDALRRNDAYPYLRATDDLITTGPTGTNVNDVVVVLVGGGT